MQQAAAQFLQVRRQHGLALCVLKAGQAQQGRNHVRGFHGWRVLAVEGFARYLVQGVQVLRDLIQLELVLLVRIHEGSYLIL